MTLRLSRRRFLTTAAAGGLTAASGIALPYVSRAADRPMVSHGVQSGDVNTDSGVVWARTALYLALRQAPQTLLVFAGAFNGMILPVGFAVLLFVAWRRRDLMHGYRYPAWLLVVGVLAWLVSVYIAVNALTPMVALFSGA